MSTENIIEVKDVKKFFKVYSDKGYSLKERLIFHNRNRYEKRNVLKGISFNVKKGEAIGLIGKNGCGKSTTLKLLSKIMYPNEGSIIIKGRVSSLLELGAGFHPDMSGRENIYTNASIFGLKKKEIDARMESIIKFSELEEFMDNPVRTYSSGMYMRLAFSIAINVNADILLIDEILTVGDISFQTKCFERLKEIKRNGATIIIVSHSMTQIEQICDRAIWIEEGLVKEEGITKFVADRYLANMEEKRLDKIENMASDQLESEQDPKLGISETIRSGNRKVEFTDVQMVNSFGIKCGTFNIGDNITVRMKYKSNQANIKANFTIGITRDDGVYCYGCSVLLDSNEVVDAKMIGEAILVIKNTKLLPGKYYLDIGIQSKDYLLYDALCSVIEFRITTPIINEFGIISLEHQWEIDNHVIEQKQNK